MASRITVVWRGRGLELRLIDKVDVTGGLLTDPQHRFGTSNLELFYLIISCSQVGIQQQESSCFSIALMKRRVGLVQKLKPIRI